MPPSRPCFRGIASARVALLALLVCFKLGAGSGRLAEPQLAALRKIYRDTGGPGWIGEKGKAWHEGMATLDVWDPCSNRTGVGCSADGLAVTSLDLTETNLVGMFPARAVCALINITRIELASNRLGGNIPGCIGDELGKLRKLNLGNFAMKNRIRTGVDSLLVGKPIGGNELIGTVPSSLCKLRSVCQVNPSLANRHFRGLW